MGKIAYLINADRQLVNYLKKIKLDLLPHKYTKINPKWNKSFFKMDYDVDKKETIKKKD